jgi:hypothetical protein
MKTELLRKKCLKLLIEKGLEKTPRYRLALLISPHEPENPQALSMALTGYRKTKSSERILRQLYDYLIKKAA